MQNRFAKITASMEAGEALDRMLKAANDGFTGGRLSKSDLTSWIVLYFEKEYFRQCLSDMRADHFNQVAYLEAVIRKLKQNEEADTKQDLTELLAPILGRPLIQHPKRNKKTAMEVSVKQETRQEQA